MFVRLLQIASVFTKSCFVPRLVMGGALSHAQVFATRHGGLRHLDDTGHLCIEEPLDDGLTSHASTNSNENSDDGSSRGSLSGKPRRSEFKIEEALEHMNRKRHGGPNVCHGVLTSLSTLAQSFILYAIIFVFIATTRRMG